MYSSKKVVGISTISRKEHLASQTRKVVATKEVLPQVTGRGKLIQCTNVFWPCIQSHLVLSLNVVEVAHDYQPQVMRYHWKYHLLVQYRFCIVRRQII